MNYRKEIDGLRALAVLPVILFHAGFSWCGGGFVGVDVFFVISGYLISTIIYTELESGRFSLLGFYERRARRILPALFVVLSTCIPFAWFLLSPDDLTDFARSLAAVAVFASNISFWLESGYFDTAAELKPLLHTWSLSVEEQFYLFFPLFLICTKKLGMRRMLYLLGVLLVCSLALAQWQVATHPSATFFLLPTRGWELALGAVVALCMLDSIHLRMSPWLRESAGVIGVMAIATAIFLFNSQTPFPGGEALMPTLGSALVILCASPETMVGKCLGNKLLVGIGAVSYSAYLWHQPIFAFLRQKLYEQPSTSLSFCAIGLTFLLAYLSWRLVETPFRQKGRFSRRLIFTLALLTSLGFFSIGLAGVATHGFPDRAAALKTKPLVYRNRFLLDVPCDDTTVTALGELNFCRRSRKGAINAVVIGDSHAEDKMYGIESNVTNLHWALVGQASCPPVIGVSVESIEKGCQEKFEKIIPWLVNSRNIETVVLSFYGGYALDTSYAADHLRNHLGPETVTMSSPGKSGRDKPELLYYGLGLTVKSLLASGKRVIILIDEPELPFMPMDCVKGRPNCNILRSSVLQRQQDYRNMLARLQTEYPAILIFDPLDFFCTGPICGYKVGDVVMYRDSHHLSAEGSDYYGKKFNQWLTTLPYGHDGNRDSP